MSARPPHGPLHRLLLLLWIPFCVHPQAIGAASETAGPSGDLQIARTVMEDASPSSFAVGFPNGLSFCYDPVRGGLIYAWRGGFADLTPAWPEVGKFVKPVKLLGEVVYRESGRSPLRRGDPGREAAVEFKGYRLGDGMIEFRYTVDGVRVREEVSAPSGGDRIVRRFHIDATEANLRWWYVPGIIEGAALSAPGSEPEAGAYRFESGPEGVFTLEIVLPEKRP